MAQSYRNSDPHPPIMAGSPPPPEWRVARARWDQPAWNRWALQNIRQVVPTVEVWRGAGPARPLPEAHRPVEEIAFEPVSGGRMTVAEMLDATYADGFLVIHRGQVVHESYWNGMGPRSLHVCMSVSKSVTSLTAGALMGEGRLAPETGLEALMPELSETAWRGATVQDVLDMAGGAVFSEDYTGPTSDIARMFVACGWKPPSDALEGAFARCIWDLILTRREADAPHGTRFAYRSLETDVLAHGLERAAGARLAELVSTRIWQRIGAEESAAFVVDPAGYALGCGGFQATLRDLGRLGLMLLEEGRVGGAQVVPAAYVEDIFAGPHGMIDDYGRHNHPNGLYRNQFWIEDRDRETVLMKGVFGQLVLVDRAAGLVAVKLSSWPEYLVPEFDLDARRAIRAIEAALA